MYISPYLFWEIYQHHRNRYACGSDYITCCAPIFQFQFDTTIIYLTVLKTIEM